MLREFLYIITENTSEMHAKTKKFGMYRTKCK